MRISVFQPCYRADDAVSLSLYTFQVSTVEFLVLCCTVLSNLICRLYPFLCNASSSARLKFLNRAACFCTTGGALPVCRFGLWPGFFAVAPPPCGREKG